MARWLAVVTALGTSLFDAGLISAKSHWIEVQDQNVALGYVDQRAKTFTITKEGEKAGWRCVVEH